MVPSMRVIFVCVHAFSEKTKENVTVKTYKIASYHNSEGLIYPETKQLESSNRHSIDS